ncbi:MarR family winged helix-turn-helix transcriptional regulator [Sphingobium sp. YR657]|uniref:MarR family winged helix-turn-helix transcriptional regulator n=1 Tax=Sphingobium sp. YR657 TaxID=1884366 RepID=UPI003138462C
MPARQPVAIDAAKEGVKLGRLDDFLGFRLRRVQNSLSGNFAQAIASYGLRSGEFTTLALVAANPGISQNELAREVGLDKSVMVLIVDDLEKREWAFRGRSKTDRRRHSLSITPAGQAELDAMFAALERTEGIVEQGFSRAELNLLHELLDRMHALCIDAAA